MDPTPAVHPVDRSVEEHLAAVLAGVHPLAAERVDVERAVGLVLAEPVRSTLDLPRFDSSAMDGYAVRSADLVGVDPDRPVVLPVVDDVPAGSLPHGPLRAGTAVRVMTGAPVPAGTQAVVPVEHTDRGAVRVRVDRAPVTGAHVRRRGEDVRSGQVVLEAGTTVTAAGVGLLAGTGTTTVLVHRRPRVLVLSTGAEVVPAGAPLAGAQIHDADGPMLAAAVQAAGGVPVRAPVVPDEPGALLRAVGPHLAEVDMVLTSAGVSEGVHDVVKADLAAVGVTFARVRMQPGRPQGAGWIDGVPVLTLPGNPASAYVSFHVFVRPVLRRMLGHPAGPSPATTAVVTEPLRSPAGRRRHLRARRGTADDGTPVVTPSGGPGSHLLGGLGTADCLLVLAEDVHAVPAGATVPIIPTEGAHP